MPKNNTDKFLKAIRKYAKQQKSALRGEVKQLKEERIKEAENKAKRDREQLIKQQLREKKSAKTAELAKLTREGQRKLFIARSEMTDEVFAKAQSKLVDFTATEAYTEKLFTSVKAVSDYFGDSDCVVYVCERDMDMADRIKECFKGNVEVRSDRAIIIGGIRGYCESMGVIVDETLDTKLDAQREWFVENSTLSVL